ncbi:MAG: hypothetical protein OEY94_05135 [Alphaproteobacteria bacterium]|nr:hypothetical protein [Alphaproteobacteria bacterium]
MYQIILFALLCAFCTMVLIAPIAMSKKFVSYLIIFLVPAFSLSLYMIKGAPGMPSQPALYDTNDERIAMRGIVKDEMNALKTLYENPEDKRNLMVLAGIQVAQGKFGEAISYLENALMKWEDDQDLKLQLGAAHFAQGLLLIEQNMREDALQSFYNARRITPKEAPFLPDLIMFTQELEKMSGVEIMIEPEPDEPEPKNVDEAKDTITPEPAPKPKPDLTPEPKPEIKPDPEPKPEPVTEPVTEPKPEINPEPEPKQETEPEPEPVTEPAPEPEPKPDPIPESKIETANTPDSNIGITPDEPATSAAAEEKAVAEAIKTEPEAGDETTEEEQKDNRIKRLLKKLKLP